MKLLCALYHTFEPRYDETSRVTACEKDLKHSSYETNTIKTYIYDICVRCAEIITRTS